MLILMCRQKKSRGVEYEKLIKREKIQQKTQTKMLEKVNGRPAHEDWYNF